MNRGILYLIIGLLMGLLIVSVFALYGESSSSSGSSGSTPSTTQTQTYTPPSPPTETQTPTQTSTQPPGYDPENEYRLEAKVTVRVTQQNYLVATIDEAKIFKYNLPGLDLPSLQWLLQWMESDWTITAEFVTPDGKVRSKVLFDDALAPGDTKTFEFSMSIGSWTQGELRIKARDMSGYERVVAVKFVKYEG